MFFVKEHLECCEAFFEREVHPENRDLCICTDVSTLPTPYGKALVRMVLDGMSHGEGKEAVEIASEVLLYHAASRMNSMSRNLALYIEESVHANKSAGEISAYLNSTIQDVLLGALEAANRSLRQCDLPNPHCTVSIAVVFYRHVYSANMGDSPIYLLDLTDPEAELMPLFTCDNAAAERIRTGELTEEEALHSPLQSRVHRFLGYKGFDILEDKEIHFTQTKLPKSCLLLLGSDGALSQLLRKDMTQAIRRNLPDGLAAVQEELQHLVAESGSTDDFTLVMDWIETD